jgi:hypothetical protein
MAQIKNNQVKFGVNPAFNTRTTTPQMRGTVDLQSAMRGVPGGTPFNMSYIPGPQSKIPAPKAPLVPGTNNYTPMSIQTLTRNAPQQNQPNISPSTPQNVQTSGPATNSTNSQLDSIRNQALGIQDLLNQKKASESAQTTNTNNTNETTFKGILDTLLGKSNPTREQERARKEMERIAAGNKEIGDNAARMSKEYSDEIARVGGLKAGAVAGNLSTGTNVVGSGNAAIASQSASARMQSLAEAQASALKGTEQQLTAQEQQANAFNPSLQASLTQQQQGIQGVSTAGNLAQPIQVPYSNQFLNPISGQSAGGAGLGGYSGFKSMEQTFDIAGQYPDAGFQYNPSLSPEQNLQNMQMAQQGSPTYQKGTFGAAGANSYIGGQQLGAAGTLTGQVAQLQTMGAAADSNFNLMLDILKRGKINDMNQPVLNQLQQGLSRGLTSNQDVVAFRSGLQTVRSQYAAILGQGTPTDATQAMAAEKIPDTVSLAALQEVERTMKTMINNTVASYNQQIGAYSNQGGGGNSFAEQW